MKTVEPIFILAGQSNMAGRCSAEDLPERFRPSKTTSDYGLDYKICWNNDRNLSEGCNSNDSFERLQAQHSPGLNMDIFGPEMALANSLAPGLQNRGIQKAYFIKFAMGSTNLHSNWNPTNSNAEGKMTTIGYYSTFLDYCKSSLSFLQSAESEIDRPLWGMFWLQGESDSSRAKDANAYLTNFKHFIETLRDDLASPDLPVVVSPVIWRGKKVHVVNQSLKQAAESEVANCFCIRALDKDECGVQGDDAGFCAGHLTACGLCEIGLRMGKALPLPGSGTN